MVVQTPPDAIWRRRQTLHEGAVLYSKRWNFWVRASATADLRAALFFPDYEAASPECDQMLRDAGFTWSKAETEEEVWRRIGNAWAFMRDHTVFDTDGNAKTFGGEWPSIQQFAKAYAKQGAIPLGTCFSQAHFLATLLGRLAYPRFRFGIATSRYPPGPDEPAAVPSHVYVGVYVADRWFYLDPTREGGTTAFPAFSDRRSIGDPSFKGMDYEHPFSFIPAPLSGFDGVPHLPG